MDNLRNQSTCLFTTLLCLWLYNILCVVKIYVTMQQGLAPFTGQYSLSSRPFKLASTNSGVIQSHCLALITVFTKWYCCGAILARCLTAPPASPRFLLTAGCTEAEEHATHVWSASVWAAVGERGLLSFSLTDHAPGLQHCGATQKELTCPQCHITEGFSIVTPTSESVSLQIGSPMSGWLWRKTV